MEDINIDNFQPLVKPEVLKLIYPRTEKITIFIKNTRNEIKKILDGVSKKKIFIIGPCSIHNTKEAFEYAKDLKKLSDKVKDKILIIMRVYFEKPRTTIGWKGLINDPDLDNSYQVNKGLAMARKLLMDINELGLPCGYEVLDTITPQYIADLMSWGAIGARTTESQVHRQMGSGLSMPIGFKNSTNGDLEIVCDSVISASFPHCFMGITDKGIPAICKTKGNSYCHIILRGNKKEPNYKIKHLNYLEEILEKKNLNTKIMIDCSHGNSRKNYKNQKIVLKETINNMKIKNNIIGIMLESNLLEGKQTLDHKHIEYLKYGVSITDSCISIIETFQIVLDAYISI